MVKKCNLSVIILRAGIMFLLGVCPLIAFGGVTATPKYLFLDASRRSTTINVTNPETQENEVWVEMKFGYVTSDDTGKIFMVTDTSGYEDQSAASWLKSYPQRFILGPGETQTVRLVASPPASLADGEYWSRIIVSSKPRKQVGSANPNAKTMSAGFVLITRLDLAFHYHVGRTVTGLDIENLKAAQTTRGIDVSMKLTRLGNAAFWGICNFRLVDHSGKAVVTSTKNVAVYRTLTLREILDSNGIFPGSYTIEIELISGKRTDLSNELLVKTAPIRTSIPFEIP